MVYEIRIVKNNNRFFYIFTIFTKNDNFLIINKHNIPSYGGVVSKLVDSMVGKDTF